MSHKLIFVYNADGGLFNTVTDIAHKLLSPSTYNCQLCAITHSAFAMRQEWKQFLQTIPNEMIFLHRDEWQEQYPGLDVSLPAILVANDTPALLVSSDEINQCQTLEALKQLIKDRLPAENSH